MKHTQFFFFLLLTLTACKNDPPKNQETVAPVAQIVDSVPHTDTVASPAASQEQVPAVMPNPDAGKATITGDGVSMRKEASVQSEMVGSCTKGEKVSVLTSKNVENDREAILTKDVTFQGPDGEITLPKGKAVLIDEYKSERNIYAVSYDDPKKGKLTADIESGAIETITYATWYKVEKAGGESGWVLGKFLKTN